MKLRYLLLLPLALATACESKYPYPPQYVSSYEVSERSIPQPPAPASREYNDEIDSIIARQAKLTPAQIAETKHQDQIRPEVMIYPTLGESYSEARYPLFYGLMKRAASDSWRIGDDARDYWRSPRPWYADRRVALHVEPIYSYGYPSGHTTTFGTWAYLLADLFPEKSDAFFQHAWSVAENRINGGAHFPHDIDGGKQMAAATYRAMRENPKFQADLAEVRAELKR